MTVEKTVTIRPETVADYPAVAAVHFAAFGRLAEVLIVTFQRQYAAFDPELSLVAEVNGQVAGHVLFMPHRVQLLGEMVRAVNLAPIGILPEFQKLGLGGKLIEAGHKAAREKGYEFSFLLGHPSYYPRFGYLPGALGQSSLKVAWDFSQNEAAGAETGLKTRPLEATDGPALYRLWEATALPGWDFALEPGREVAEWATPNSLFETPVYVDGAGEIAGYTRGLVSTPEKPVAFLAKDGAAARAMLALLAHKKAAPGEVSGVEFELPLHPLSKLAADLGGETRSRTGDYAMVCPLRPGVFDEYYAQVRAGSRPPGYPVWSPAFDFDV